MSMTRAAQISMNAVSAPLTVAAGVAAAFSVSGEDGAAEAAGVPVVGGAGACALARSGRQSIAPNAAPSNNSLRSFVCMCDSLTLKTRGKLRNSKDLQIVRRLLRPWFENQRGSS